MHINRTHSMRSGLAISPRLGINTGGGGGTNLPSPPLSSGSSSCRLRMNTSDSTPLARAGESLGTQDDVPAMRAPVRPFKRERHRRNRASQTSLQLSNEEGVVARANRIRAMFSVQLKESDTFPGISRGKTGKLSDRPSIPSVPFQHIAELHFFLYAVSELASSRTNWFLRELYNFLFLKGDISQGII